MSQILSKNKILIITISVLLLTNIVTLFFYSTQKQCDHKKHREERKSKITAFLKNDIKFSEQQLAMYDSMTTLHHKSIEPMMDSFRTKKSALMNELSATGFTESAIDVTLTSLSAYQLPLEKNMLHYIKSIREICTPEQMAAFDSGFFKMLHARNDKKK